MFSFLLDRPFAGQITAAGKINPTKVLVLGTGVAGLAAIQSAKSLGGVVRAFDVRKAAAEQVKAVGASFVDVEKYMKDKNITLSEDGEGAGGYAKEMSPEWFDVARRLLTEECAKSDVIIATAQVPGMSFRMLVFKVCAQLMVACREESTGVDHEGDGRRDAERRGNGRSCCVNWWKH